MSAAAEDAGAPAAAAAPAAPETAAQPTTARTLLRNGVHLTVLSAFAISQPLFSLLGDNAEFFAARDAPAIDIVVFALAATLLPPLLLLAIEALAGLAGRQVRAAVHLLFVGGLAAMLAIQVLKRATSAPTTTMLIATAAIGAGCAAFYARSRSLRSTLTVLSPAPLLFLTFFLCFSPVSKLVLPSSEPALAAVTARTSTPVVMLVFDEFSLVDLMGPDGRLDTVRYPNFGRLAERATWYRNASAVYDSTTQAVPALLSGRLPHKGQLPTLKDHPGNLITLLGRTGRTNVSEEATSLCPDRLCPQARSSAGFAARLRALGEDVGLVYLHKVAPPSLERELPSVSESWGEFGGGSEEAEEEPAVEVPAASAAAVRRRPSILQNLGSGRGERTDAWIARIGGRRAPVLSLKHALLPHVPLLYLPSGRMYRTSSREPIPGQTSQQSWNDQVLVDQTYQRHLLQVGYADHELGKLIDRLQKAGLWEKALVVVTADHGVAFRRGEDRRVATTANLAEVASIPMFVKAPNQKRGVTSDVWLRSIDLVPTIGALLSVRIPWKMDGSPAGSAKVRQRRSVTMLRRGFGGTVTLTAAEFTRRRDAVLARKQQLFGDGDEQPGLYGLGPHRELVGRSLTDLTIGTTRKGYRAELNDPKAFGAVRRSSGVVPVHVTGTVTGDDPGARRDFAIAVNGRVEAVTRSAYLTDEPQQRVSAMVPEQAMREGRNVVQLFVVEGDGGRLRLTELASSGRP